ncbi:unnamed protein product [Sphagnum troendelagicum]
MSIGNCLGEKGTKEERSADKRDKIQSTELDKNNKLETGVKVSMEDVEDCHEEDLVVLDDAVAGNEEAVEDGTQEPAGEIWE